MTDRNPLPLDGIPVVRLEVERMRFSILHAFHAAQLQLDQQVQAALDEAIKPENVARVIAAEVGRTLELVIREEVERFYRYGSGRERVREAVVKRLSE